MKLHLNHGTEYAYQALLLLDDSRDEYLTSMRIAEELDVSAGYLTKILAPLTREGWVTSSPGPAGGYRLSADLNALCVLDLVEAVEGQVDRSQCMHGDSRNPVHEKCALHDPWIRARDSLLSELEMTPLGKSGQSSRNKGE